MGMLLRLAIAAALLTGCDPAREPSIPETTLPPTEPPAPAIFHAEIMPAGDLVVLLGGLDVPPYDKFWVPDAVFLVQSKALLLSDERRFKLPHVRAGYGDRLWVWWRKRDLYASVDNRPRLICYHPMDPAVEMELFEALELEGMRPLAPPEPKWRRLLELRVSRPIVRFADDAQRDRVAREGWQP